MENSQAALLTLGFLLFLKGSSALVVTPVTDPVISKVGDNVQLEIKPPGPLIEVTWTFSPAGITVVSWAGLVPVTGAGYENRVTMYTTTGSVELRSVNLSDAGVYAFQGTIFVSGTLDTFNGNVTLKVDGSSALVVTPVTDPVISKVGDNVQLEIKPPGVLGAVVWTFSAAGIPVVSWAGLVPVTGAGYENRVTLNTTTGSVELRSVNLSDAGVYAFQGNILVSGILDTFNGNVTLRVYGLGSLSSGEIAGIVIGTLAGVTGVALGVYFSVKLCRNNPHDLRPGPAQSSPGAVTYENFKGPSASATYENTTAIRRAGEAKNPDSTYTGLQFPDQSTYSSLNRP
ncbi:uncharacterized protein LOC131709074 [Acipenser ruthenus]|uniref:uncharacterized protein LOC131709074 n=1 Tax=Acipenser ruthenus TaxID=7906 RepID=UPI00274163CF|nr:uncharacterized protein LOC131709074 [Acipenser ruthenus]